MSHPTNVESNKSFHVVKNDLNTNKTMDSVTYF